MLVARMFFIARMRCDGSTVSVNFIGIFPVAIGIKNCEKNLVLGHPVDDTVSKISHGWKIFHSITPVKVLLDARGDNLATRQVKVTARHYLATSVPVSVTQVLKNPHEVG